MYVIETNMRSEIPHFYLFHDCHLGLVTEVISWRQVRYEIKKMYNKVQVFNITIVNIFIVKSTVYGSINKFIN